MRANRLDVVDLKPATRATLHALESIATLRG